MSWRLLGAALIALLPAAAHADGALTDTSAFEHADAASFYSFDACGDALSGRAYRRALMDRFRGCPFTEAARTRFADRIAAQQRLSRKKVNDLIEQNGGLPVRLDGMSRTCHEQMASPDYQQMQDKLERYASGQLTADAVLPSPCDAPAIQP